MYVPPIPLAAPSAPRRWTECAYRTVDRCDGENTFQADEQLDRLAVSAVLDAPDLKPLPTTRYEISRWKSAKVNIDYKKQPSAIAEKRSHRVEATRGQELEPVFVVATQNIMTAILGTWPVGRAEVGARRGKASDFSPATG